MKKLIVNGLVVVLGLSVVLAGFLFIPDLLHQKKIDSAVDRMTVGSMLLRSAIELEEAKRQWPKNLKEIQDASPKALAVKPSPSLDGVEYNLVKNNGETAIYEFVYGGARRKVTATSAFGKQRGPLAAGMSVGSQ